MRENIGLFKAKRKNEPIKVDRYAPNGWVYGNLIQTDDNFYIAPNDISGEFYDERPYSFRANDLMARISLAEIDPETLCECTELKDDNGKLIFEGDKVKTLYADWMSKSDNDNRTLEEYLDSLCKIGTVEKNNFNGGWHLNFGDYYNNICCGEYGYIEVIGNKFEEVRDE